MARIIPHLFKHPYKGIVGSKGNRNIQPGPILDELIKEHNRKAEEQNKLKELDCSPISFSHKLGSAVERLISEGPLGPYLERVSLQGAKAHFPKYKYNREIKRIKDNAAEVYELVTLTEDNWLTEEAIKNKFQNRANEARRKKNSAQGLSSTRGRCKTPAARRAGQRRAAPVSRIARRSGRFLINGAASLIQEKSSHGNQDINKDHPNMPGRCPRSTDAGAREAVKESLNLTIHSNIVKVGYISDEDEDFSVSRGENAKAYESDLESFGSEACPSAAREEVFQLVLDDSTQHGRSGNRKAPESHSDLSVDIYTEEDIHNNDDGDSFGEVSRDLSDVDDELDTPISTPLRKRELHSTGTRNTSNTDGGGSVRKSHLKLVRSAKVRTRSGKPIRKSRRT